MTSHRDRKRARTRQAIIDAAADLFERRGYDGTTIADIAEAAGIGTRTFFSYFAGKEEVLFSERDSRVAAAITAIETREPTDRPADVLLRALRDVNETDTDMGGPMARLRLRFVRTVPVVRGRALQEQLDAQLEIARHLEAAFPAELDAVRAAAIVGAFVGAINAALHVLFAEPDAMADPRRLQERMREATELALRPFLR